MKSRDKTQALIAMWIVIAILAGVTFTSLDFTSSTSWVFAIFAVVFGAMALGGTYIIAIMTRTMPDSGDRTHESDRRDPGKAKTSDLALVDRMVESLSDEELAALRRRLLAGEDDGEVISLEEALQARRGERR